MGENYRTLLGHFRHELGHYYWDRLIRDDPALAASASARRSATSAPDYARSAWPPLCAKARRPTGRRGIFPPMRRAILGGLGRDLRPPSPHHRYAGNGACAEFSARPARHRAVERAGAQATRRRDRCRPGPAAAPTTEPFHAILGRWLVLSEASNSINRCMGLPDLYPFVISPAAEGKLAFVHELIAAKGGRTGA